MQLDIDTALSVRALARLGPALLLCCLALVPSVAHAQLDTGERFDGQGHRVLFELGGAERREGPFGVFTVPRDVHPPLGSTASNPEPHSFSGATFGLYARARTLTDGDPSAPLGEGGALTMDLELAWRGTATGDDVGRSGNALISTALGWATSDLVLRVAFGAGLPLTNAYFSGQRDEGRAYSLLRASQGHGDGWLATEESIPVVLRARVEGRTQWLFAGGDLGGALMPTVPRNDERSSLSPSADDLIAIAQVGGWLGVRPIEQLAIGARGQLVVQHGGIESADPGYGFPSEMDAGSSFVVIRSPTFVPDQLEAFVSLIAFVRGEIDDLTLEGRLYLNLDTPDGVAFDQGATWSASLTAGWTP